MPHTITFQSDERDAALRELAERVLTHFELPQEGRLLCYCSDYDSAAIRKQYGSGVRGLHHSFAQSGDLPDEVSSLFWNEYADDVLYDDLVYLLGSTCSTEMGFVLTFAHELQHYCQISFHHNAALANCVFRELGRQLDPTLKPCNLPYERDADLKAKRIAEELFGAEVGRTYLESQAELRPEEKWEYIASVLSTEGYDWVEDTRVWATKYKAQIDSFKDKVVDWNELRNAVVSS